jgi:hypothetical protein
VQGDPGAVGAQGPKGDPGPTSAWVGGINTDIVSAGTSIGVDSAGVTLEQPGKVLVLVTGTFSVGCGAAECQRVISANVGATSVPGLFASIKALAGQKATERISAAGILTNVPAGTHQVQIAHQLTGNPNSTGNRGDVRIVAVAVG